MWGLAPHWKQVGLSSSCVYLIIFESCLQLMVFQILCEKGAKLTCRGSPILELTSFMVLGASENSNLPVNQTTAKLTAPGIAGRQA